MKKRLVIIINGNGTPFIADKQQRNEKCRCGSERKSKHCCGAETRLFVRTKPENVETKTEPEEPTEEIAATPEITDISNPEESQSC